MGADRQPVDERRAFILMRKDHPGDHEGCPVAVYVGDNAACKGDMEHRQSVNPDSHYYVLDKKLNPKSAALPPHRCPNCGYVEPEPYDEGLDG